MSRRILSKADSIRVVSDRIKNSLLHSKNYKLKIKPSILPIFVDARQFDADGERFNFRAIDATWTFVLLWVGRLENEKNPFLALDVLEKIKKSHPNTALVFLGEGSLLPILVDRAKKLGLEKHTAFLGKVVSLVKYYRGANALLNTSNYEGFGMSLVEAGYCGLPIISTDSGIAGSLLQNNKDCLVCPVGGLECLALAGEKLMQQSDLRSQFSVNASQNLKTSLIQNKEEYLLAYKKSLEGKNQYSLGI